MIIVKQIPIITLLFYFCEYRTVCSNINGRNKQAIYSYSNLARLVGKNVIKETEKMPNRRHRDMDDIMNLDTAEFLNIIKEKNYEHVDNIIGAGIIRRMNKNNIRDSNNLNISEFLTEPDNSKHENNTIDTEKIGRENENKIDERDTAKFLNITKTENSQYLDNIIDTASIEREAQNNYDAIVNLDTAEFLNVLKTGNYNNNDNIIGMRKMRQPNKNKKYLKKARMKQIISSNKHINNSVRNIQEKISNLKIESYPFLASIQIFDECLCAGAIIQRNLIITAASCLKKSYRKTNDFKEIKVGVASDFCDKDGQLLQVYKIHFHHLYDPWTDENNLALIQVNEDLITERYKNTMMIFIEYNSRALAYSSKLVNITILGWGDKSKQNKSNTLPKRITKTEQMYYDTEKCQKIYKRRYVPEKSFCGKSFMEQATGCNKDVGNPALFKGRLVGIINYGPSTCKIPNIPTVFTKLSSYKLWIETVMVMAMAEVMNYDLPSEKLPLLGNLKNIKKQQESTNNNNKKIKVMGNIVRNGYPKNHEKPEKELDSTHTIYKDYQEEITETALDFYGTIRMFSNHATSNIVSNQPRLNNSINKIKGKNKKDQNIFAPRRHEKPAMELNSKIYEDSKKELTESVLEHDTKFKKFTYKVISLTPLLNNGINKTNSKNNTERTLFIHGKHKQPRMELANTFYTEVTEAFLKSTEKTRMSTGHPTYSMVSPQPLLNYGINNTKGKSNTEQIKLIPHEHEKSGIELDKTIYKYSDEERTETAQKSTIKTKKPLYNSELVELLLKNGLNKTRGKNNAEGNFVPHEHEKTRMKLHDTTYKEHYKEITKDILKSHEKSRTYSSYSTNNIVSLQPLLNNGINKTKSKSNTQRINFISNKHEKMGTVLRNTIYNDYHKDVTKAVLRSYTKIKSYTSFPTYSIRKTSPQLLFENGAKKTKVKKITAQDKIIHNEHGLTETKTNTLIFKVYRKEITTGSNPTYNTVSLQPLVNNGSQGRRPVLSLFDPAERRNKKKVEGRTKLVSKEHEKLESESYNTIYQDHYKDITEESHESTRDYENNGIVGGRTWMGKSKKYLLKTSVGKEKNNNQKSFTNKVTPNKGNLYPKSQETAIPEAGVEKNHFLKTTEGKEKNNNQKSFTRTAIPKKGNLYSRSQETAVPKAKVEKKHFLKTSEGKEKNNNQNNFTKTAIPKKGNLYPRSQETAVPEGGVEGTTCNSYEEFVAPYIKKRSTQPVEPIIQTIGRITKIDTEELGLFGVSNAFDKNSLERLNNRGGIYY